MNSLRNDARNLRFFRSDFDAKDESVASELEAPGAEEVTSSVNSWKYCLRREFIGKLVESVPFKGVVFVSIVFNAVIIGAQTNRQLEDDYGEIFTALDSCCLAVAVLEILLKLYADFRAFWRSGWNVFDFLVVTGSLIAPSFTFLDRKKFVVVIRLMRALRLLRGINVLPGLQVVVQAVLKSLSDMANIVLLLLIVMFIFAILGVTFFGEASKRYFGDLPAALFTLFICITQDGWMGVFEELEKEGMYVAAAVYLVAFIMIGAFVFANLVVAVVVTNLEITVDKQRQAKGSKIEERKPEEEKNLSTSTVDVSALLSQHWRSQRPYEIPDMASSTSVEKLENYFIVLSALEDNINRFKTLKQELSEIIHDVKELNPKWDETHVLTTPADVPVRNYRVSNINRRPSMAIRGDRTGDLLSDLLALNREKHIDSRNANVMSDLVKQTVFYLYRKDSNKNATRTASFASINHDRND